MSVFYRSVFAAAVFVAGGVAGGTHWRQDAVKTVVLVHGAWADGSSWAEVVPLLEAAGLNVVAVQNPLSSFESDVANTVRVIDDQPGDVILVGHSYGGMVITEAGNNPKVKALVYVAAFAPGGRDSRSTRSCREARSPSGSRCFMRMPGAMSAGRSMRWASISPRTSRG